MNFRFACQSPQRVRVPRYWALAAALALSISAACFSGDIAPTTSQPCDAEWPAVSYEDLVLLVKTARRSFETRLRSGMEATARYRPPSLSDSTGIVHVVLRSRGRVVIEAESPEMSVVDAANAAGDLLGRSALEKKLQINNGGSELGLEFEWLGPREYLQEKYTHDMKWSEALLHTFEPAAEGIGVELADRRGRTRPAEIITGNYSPDLAILAAENRAGIKFISKIRKTEQIQYFRFPAVLLWQESARTLPIRLYRGEKLIADEQVDLKSVDAAIQKLGDYLLALIRKDGGFAQEYLIGSDAYKPGYDGDKQLAGLTALAVLTDWRRDKQSMSIALSAVKRICEHVRPAELTAAEGKSPADPLEQGLIVDFVDQQQCLESTARLFWVLNKLGRPSAFEEQRKGLLKALMAAPAEDGHFEMGFVRRDTHTPQDARAAAWAMLAICQNGVSDGKTLSALKKGQSYYQDWYARHGAEGPQPNIAILVRAFAQGYVNTNDARISDLCFEILDRWAGLQLDRRSCPWPELWGAINAAAPGAVGIDTACYVAALSDGVELAERIGDQKRADQYRTVIRKALRFILQLQFHGEGCFYVRFPQDVLGAVRAAPWDHRIRIDYCGDALIALIRAHQVLGATESKQ